MSFEASRVTIYGHFAALWDMNAYPLVAENQPWPQGRQPTSAAWGRYSIRPASNLSIDVGATSKRVTGLVWLQMFLKENTGVKAAQIMADVMEDIFAEKTLLTADSVLRFDRAELGYAGKDAAGWEQHRCTVSYIEDAVTAGVSNLTMGFIIDIPTLTRRTGGTSTDLDALPVARYKLGQTISFTREGSIEFYKLFAGAASAAHHVATPDAARHWEMTGGVM